MPYVWLVDLSLPSGKYYQNLIQKYYFRDRGQRHDVLLTLTILDSPISFLRLFNIRLSVVEVPYICISIFLHAKTQLNNMFLY